MKRILLAALALSSLATLPGCAVFQRSVDSGYPQRQKVVTTYSTSGSPRGDTETVRTAYEMGFNPSTMSGEEQHEVERRIQLRALEKTLDSKQERLQYSKVLPWLRSDEEKIEMLSIPSLEGRQAWINRNNVWARARMPENRMKELIDSQDISVGMPMEYVKRAWGDPALVEVSGNPIYKNERWKYIRNVPGSDGFHQQKRSVYFEGGKVVGWETE